MITPGTLVIIRYRLDNQRRDRECCLKYLGARNEGNSPTGQVLCDFDARPLAGTQTLPRTAIKSVTRAPFGATVYLNKLV